MRAEFPYINDDYLNYLLESYDDTYYPEKIVGTGRAVYVERNREMIDKSRFCIVYYDEGYTPSSRSKTSDMLIVARKSGTKLALDYAIKKKKEIFIFTSAGLLPPCTAPL